MDVAVNVVHDGALKAMDSVPHPTLDEILSLLDEMATHQRGKVLVAARRIIPHLTADDVLNPHDFPELESAGEFHYEDGILAGLLAAQAAIRARQGQNR